MMKRIDAKNAVKRFTCQGQTFSIPLSESGSWRLGLRISQHLSRGFQTRHANSSTAEGPKPMAGAAANLEYALVEMPADEGNQRRLDTGVVVHLVSSVVRVGNEVVIYVSSHRGSGVRLTLYSSKAAIAGSCHGMTSSTASVL